MFRRLSSSLPKDPDFPHDLEGLGYFINDKEEIKQIAHPSEEFEYFMTKNDRYNEMHREAMNICTRRIVLDRLLALGLTTLRLPLGTTATDPHIPILVGPDLSSKSRVILIFNEAMQDLGIWAYREIGSRGGINQGSMVNMIKLLYSMHNGEKEAPGVVIANLGQLIWYRGGKKAVSSVSWHSLPRKSAVHSPMRLDNVKNRVPGNEDWKAHVSYIFNEVVSKFVNKDAKIDVIGLSDGAIEARARSYILSHDPLDTLLLSPDITIPDIPSYLDLYGLNCYSAGEAEYSECIMPAAYTAILEFLKHCATTEAPVEPQYSILGGANIEGNTVGDGDDEDGVSREID
ncbi:MAG: hypothetical protein M1827_007316 [Pycnora praestabilis]|nr:MAG: hypothetical protein M1827_007316 [Pycnora praestabilis]